MAGQLFHRPIIPPYYIEDSRILDETHLIPFGKRLVSEGKSAT